MYVSCSFLIKLICIVRQWHAINISSRGMCTDLWIYNIGIEGEMWMQTGTKIRLNDQIYKYPDIKVFISNAIFNSYA